MTNKILANGTINQQEYKSKRNKSQVLMSSFMKVNENQSEETNTEKASNSTTTRPKCQVKNTHSKEDFQAKDHIRA